MFNIDLLKYPNPNLVMPHTQQINGGGDIEATANDILIRLDLNYIRKSLYGCQWTRLGFLLVSLPRQLELHVSL